ncbi:hypothetical protein PPERSA_08996 [Pseudocohnilembus persalinus]|uniref:Cytosolic endo-beta-N-acetylglucosaminidase TIM barrel domain-containing protein n=1 Tax=Pseudocohnilembus persalinus TaxID=266149 RepID=A0A0V0R2Y9_PSEPJ|nr:hypothetical protein PPERSA_08996 [Pseudocohnilembus persalinus]|eukprot:KRX08892.1 hypothetical protein PPERSA_08996 [Pseudocohnilembus persalinus]
MNKKHLSPNFALNLNLDIFQLLEIFKIMAQTSLYQDSPYLITILDQFIEEVSTVSEFYQLKQNAQKLVKSLGTFITEHEQGKIENQKLLQGKNGNPFYYAEKLIQICKFYKFDGYLLNFEADFEKNDVEKLLNWTNYLTTQIKQEIPHAIIIWYDSIVTDSGKVEWQSQVNDKNVNSAQFCIENLKKLYTGIDIWGRGQYEGGKFDSFKSIQAIKKYKTNVAIFAPAFTYETAHNQSQYIQNDQFLWQGIKTQQLFDKNKDQWKELIKGGDGWQIVKEENGDEVAITSYNPCSRQFQVNVEELNIPQFQDLNIQFSFEVKGTPPKTDDYFNAVLFVQDKNYQHITSKDIKGEEVIRNQQIQLYKTTENWEKHTITISLPQWILQEVKYLKIFEKGQDAEHWGGHFGARFKNEEFKIINQYDLNQDFTHHLNRKKIQNLPFHTYFNLAQGQYHIEGQKIQQQIENNNQQSSKFTYDNLNDFDFFFPQTTKIIQNLKYITPQNEEVNISKRQLKIHDLQLNYDIAWNGSNSIQLKISEEEEQILKICKTFLEVNKNSNQNILTNLTVQFDMKKENLDIQLILKTNEENNQFYSMEIKNEEKYDKQQMDIFSEELKLKIAKNKIKQKTTTGVSLTIILCCLALLYLIYLLNQYLSGGLSPKISTVTKTYEKKDYTLKFSPMQFKVPHNSTRIANLIAVSDPIKYKRYQEDLAYTFTTFAMKWNEKTQNFDAIYTQVCDDKQIRENPKEYGCLNVKDQEVSFYIDSQANSQPLNAIVGRCQLTGTDCFDQSYIDIAITDFDFYYYMDFILEQFDPDTKKIEKSIERLTIPGDIGQIEALNIKFKVSTVNYDDGFLFSNSNEIEFISGYEIQQTTLTQQTIAQKISDFVPVSDVRNVLLLMQLDLSLEYDYITIEYPKVSEILAQFMSIVNVIMVIGILGKMASESGGIGSLLRLNFLPFISKWRKKKNKQILEKKLQEKQMHLKNKQQYQLQNIQQKQITPQHLLPQDIQTKQHNQVTTQQIQQKEKNQEKNAPQQNQFTNEYKDIEDLKRKIKQEEEIDKIYLSLKEKADNATTIMHLNEEIYKLKQAVQFLLSKEQYAALLHCQKRIPETIIQENYNYKNTKKQQQQKQSQKIDQKFKIQNFNEQDQNQNQINDDQDCENQQQEQKNQIILNHLEELELLENDIQKQKQLIKNYYFNPNQNQNLQKNEIILQIDRKIKQCLNPIEFQEQEEEHNISQSFQSSVVNQGQFSQRKQNKENSHIQQENSNQNSQQELKNIKVKEEKKNELVKYEELEQMSQEQLNQKNRE